MEKIKLRPHHLLCQEFFVGHGYSEEFVRNLDSIIQELRTNNPIVEIIDTNDDVCKCCPNLINGKCKDIDKVKVYDQNVSKLADFNYTTYNYNDLRQAILDKIVKSSIDIKNICNDCCWINICEEIRKKMK